MTENTREIKGNCRNSQKVLMLSDSFDQFVYRSELLIKSECGFRI
jgi:hypothetical protein